MKCTAIKILYHYITGLRLQVHACCGKIAAGFEFFGVGNFNLCGVTREFRFRTSEFKTACFANNTTTTIATYQPFTFKKLVARLYSYFIRCLMNVSNG